jgi:alpha-beta hydrolase superfamily lysophospholipase
MVLVDSTAPASAATPQTTAPGDAGSYDIMGRVSALVSTSARLGVGGVSVSTFRSTIDEYVQASASAQQAASLSDFADKPLVVMTAGIGTDTTLLAAHSELAMLSTNSVHRVIDGATHQTLVAEEEHAAATTQAILDVVSSVRSPGPLVR